jgi:hypothetical protein
MDRAFDKLNDYRCLFDSYTAGDKDSRHIVFGYYFKKPQMVRMEVIEGKYPDTIILYNPKHLQDKVKLRAGNPAVAILQRLLYGETFDLSHEWVSDLRGNGVHESDWSYFIREHRSVLHLGQSRFIAEEALNGKPALHFSLVSDFPERTAAVKQEELWVDKETSFPVRFIQYDRSGKIIRRSGFRNVEFDLNLNAKIFTDLQPLDAAHRIRP